MKLRVRSIETKETLRIEVPDLTFSLQQLREVVSQRIRNPSSSYGDIHLSLNRKDELFSSSPEDDSLQSLGVTSGDLIFFTLNPNLFSRPQTLNVQLGVSHVPRSGEPQNSQETLTLDPNSQQNRTLDSGIGSSSETLGLDTHKEETFGLDAGTLEVKARGLNKDPHKEETLGLGDNHKEETLGLNTQEEETLDLSDQREEGVKNMEIDHDSPVVEGVGRSFLVPSFLRKVFTDELGDDSGRHHKLLMIAVHAVLLESGFVGLDPISDVVVNGFQFPTERPSPAARISLWYTLPAIVGHGTDAVELKFQTMGKFFSVYGSLGSGSSTHSVRVDEDWLVPFLNVVWANCGLGNETNKGNRSSSTSPETEVFKFWRNMKDKLALPLLIDLCEKAGFDLPPCFMCLPTEIKLMILESLPCVDVAKVGCVCREMRYLTSSDELWKQKFVENFGTLAIPEGSCWKEKFAKCLESRKRRKMESDSLRMARGRNNNRFRVPPIGGPNPFGGRNPFHIPPIGGGNPFPFNAIGGDYDRFPYLAPPGQQPDVAYPWRRYSSVPRCNLGGRSP